MNRLIEFCKENPVLPSPFKDVEKKHMIYAAGDAYGGFNKQNNSQTNIEAFTNLGFNVFCCAELEASNENLVYLNAHPELNIVVCILTGNNKVDFPILRALFRNSLEEINTDDNRFYPDSKTSFEMLKKGGVCNKVHQRFIIGQDKKGPSWMPVDLGWGEPNFKIIDQQRWTYNFTKTGTDYIPESNTSVFRTVQERNNAAYANRLRLENSVAWNMNRASRKRGFFNSEKGGKRKSKAKSRKNRL